MPDQFSRMRLLLGNEAADKLRHAHVAIFGVGGVGSYAAEALARCGVGSIDIIDHDRVDITNINRQVIATLDAIGHPKADIMANRISSINPDCQVAPHGIFYLPDTKDQIDIASFDYVIDAVDTVTAKLLIIEEAQRCNTPIISCMGTANKLDPTAFEVTDIYETEICPLAKIIRKESRKRGFGHFKVVYSKEPALVPVRDEGQQNPEKRSPTPGSVSFVPPVAGMIAASIVIKDLIGME